jgi:hypothetical protein
MPVTINLFRLGIGPIGDKREEEVIIVTTSPIPTPMLAAISRPRRIPSLLESGAGIFPLSNS